MRLFLCVLLILFSTIAPAQEKSFFETKDPVQKQRFTIFTNTILYGVFAGAAVGLAVSTDLQFDLNAELNLRHVARGASYGLYFGILLGGYISYIAGRPNEPGVAESYPVSFDFAPVLLRPEAK